MATPLPSEVGKYFSASNPLLWTNEMPEESVTSRKTMLARLGTAAGSSDRNPQTLGRLG